MSKQEKRFATEKSIKLKSHIVECIEKGRYCMGKFIPTRVGQTDTCIKCMKMLDGEVPPLIKSNVKRNLWN